MRENAECAHRVSRLAGPSLRRFRNVPGEATILNKAVPRFKSDLVALSIINQIIMTTETFLIKALKTALKTAVLGGTEPTCLEGTKETSGSWNCKLIVTNTRLDLTCSQPPTHTHRSTGMRLPMRLLGRRLSLKHFTTWSQIPHDLV